MAPATPTTHDPALSHTAGPGAQPAQLPPGLPTNISAADMSNLSLTGLDQAQLMTLLRNFPMSMLSKLTEGQANPKEDAAQAAQTLSNLAQTPYGQQLHYPAGPSAGGLPGINDPGPSSHPRGPPNLGQLSAVAMQAAPVIVQSQPPQQSGMSEDVSDTSETGQSAPSQPTSGGRRGANRAAMGSDEWTRLRKDNHKEVERRRRGNINEGINELGRIVPSGSGEKAKGAILARAVQYIHHLKENEARNIEKWTLEKLLMDQAMGDLQAQLEEVKRLWEEERMARTRLDAELDAFKKATGTSTKDDGSGSGKKRNAEGQEGKGPETEERDGKRARVE